MVKKEYFIFQFFVLLIFIQIVLGAFVSGLDAGKIYQTWPLMGSEYFPNDFIFEKMRDVINFDSHSLVQFYHRNLAYLIFFYSFGLSLFILKKKIFELYRPLFMVIFILITQVLLGILTYFRLGVLALNKPP